MADLEAKIQQLTSRLDKQEALIRLLCAKLGVSPDDLGSAEQAPAPAPKVRMSTKKEAKPSAE
jgi:hypothetical protein